MIELPIVDYRLFESASKSDQEAFAKSFGDGLRTHGFGVVAGHPITRDRIERAFSLIEAFFAQSFDFKKRFIVPESEGNRGYVPFGAERAVGAPVADLKEFFHVGQERPAPGANLLPNCWPTHSTAFREELLALYSDFEITAKGLLTAIARYLGLADDHFSSMITGGDSILRLIHYPPVANDAPEGAIRAAAHEDINLITLLAEGSTGGLELLGRDGGWHPVSSLRGHLVINAGDMLQRASHGRIRSTTHRVVNPKGENKARFSIPFFTHPRPDVLLQPMAPEPGYSGPAHTAITAGDYLRERLSAIKAPAKS
ncbi:MAG: 2-oxoglutarate and iron-dependent oxygenase domain-containing protein [Polyangiales bacterium]